MDGRVTLIADLMPALELGPINPDDPAGKALAGAFAALGLEVCRCDLCLNHLARLCAQSASRTAKVNRALQACRIVQAQCGEAPAPQYAKSVERDGETS